MNPSQVWKTLGIEKTSDKRGIKRAYAAKLKAVDPDADPASFLALREALDMALWQAEAAQWEDVADASDFDEAESGGTFEEEGATAEQPEDTAQIHDPDLERRHRLHAILWGEEPIQPLEEEAKALADQIVTASEAGSIEDSAMTEDWLLWLSANTIRRSDCIIPLLVTHYGWKDKAGTIHASHAHNAVLGRYRDLVQLRALQLPEHADHLIFQRLSMPMDKPPGTIESRRHGAAVRHFLMQTRTRNPTVEWDLNEDTVAQWESVVGRSVGMEEQPRAEGFSWYFWVLLAAFILNVARVMSK